MHTHYKQDNAPSRGQRRVCAFFNTPRGCRHGTACGFLHVQGEGGPPPPPPPPTRPRSVTGSFSNAPQRQQSGSYSSGSASAAGQQHESPLALEEVKRCLKQLLRSQELSAPLVQDLVNASLQLLGQPGGRSRDVLLRQLLSQEGLSLWSKALSSCHNVEWFAQVQAPLALLLCHPEVTNALHYPATNPLFALVNEYWDKTQTAAALQQLLGRPGSIADLACARLALRGKQGIPKDWIDLLHPLITLLQQLLLRFPRGSMPASVQAFASTTSTAAAAGAGAIGQGSSAAGAQQLLSAMLKAAEHHLSEGEELSRGPRAADRRRLLADLDTLTRQLNVVEEDQARLQKLFKSQEQRRRQLQGVSASEADPPGALRQVGPRHDNDHADFTLISVAPTPKEALCEVAPYIPRNRPGAVSHNPDPDVAHRELHFRLLRQDLIAPLQEAVSAFRRVGGTAQLDRQVANRQVAQAGPCSVRLHLPGTRPGDTLDLYVFRNVVIEGISSSQKSGISFEVSFEEVPQLREASLYRRQVWWKQTKQLTHGSLVCLWWQPPEPPTRPPGTASSSSSSSSGGTPGAAATAGCAQILFGIITGRDVQQLACGDGPNRKRPRVSISMTSGSVSRPLLAAVLGRQHLGGGAEVVLLQASNSYFSYEPILRALQSKAPVPLGRYILQDRTASADSAAAPATAGFGAVSRDGEVPAVPAYAADPDLLWDLTCILTKEQKAKATRQQLQRLSSFHIACPEEFPLQDLVAVSSLDTAQAEALAACLTQELALVQGPPGTGKTYVGVQLVVTLLANTCNRQWVDLVEDLDVAEMLGVGKPHVGPLLVVCYTNHALDAFLEDLLDAGVPQGDIVRVGGRSKSERLASCNLFGKSKGGAVGVAHLLRQRGELMDQLERRLDQLRSTKQAKRLHWESLAPHLERHHPHLLQAFEQRDLQLAELHAEAQQLLYTLDELPPALRDQVFEQDTDSWQVAGGSRKGQRRSKKRQQQQQQMALGASFGEDLLQDWERSSPVKDWQRRQQVQQLQQKLEAGWEEQTTATAAAAGATGSSTGPFSPTGAAQHGQLAGSSNNSRPASGAGASQQSKRARRGSLSPSDADMELAAAVSDTAGGGSSASEEGEEGGMGFNNPFAVLGSMGEDGPPMQPFPGFGPAGAPGTNLFGLGQKQLPEQLQKLLRSHTTPGRPSSNRLPAAGTGAAAGEADEVASMSEGDDDWQSVDSLPEGEAQLSKQAPLAAAAGPSSRSRTAAAAAAGGAGQVGAAAVEPAAGGQAAQQPRPPADVLVAEESDRGLDELLVCGDVSNMSSKERKLLYQHWQQQLADNWAQDINTWVEELKEVQKKLDDRHADADNQVLRQARIVGMTTTGLAAKQAQLEALGPKVVIVEEAAEVLEAHILTSMSSKTEHLILIGDHEQLRPKPQVYTLTAASRQGYDLDVSLFERLVTAGSVRHVTLETQRRMRPSISRLIRAPLYPHLRDHPQVLRYPPVAGMVREVFFLDHGALEGGQEDSKSKYNRFEVDFALGLAKYLMQQGYAGEGEITILTPYVGQLLRLREAVKQQGGMRLLISERDEADLQHALDAADAEEAAEEGAAAAGGGDGNTTAEGTSSLGRQGSGAGNTSGGGDGAAAAGAPGGGGGTRVVEFQQALRLATVDNFQGEESRIIILSLVRNPSKPEAGIGFLANKNRINVMLSRAKHGMYILGSTRALRAQCDKSRNHGDPCMWESVLDMLDAEDQLGSELPLRCQRHGTLTWIKDPREFRLLVGDGGCQAACGEALPCGHTCPRRCHADDPAHQEVRCNKPCPKLCARERHPCPRMCWQPCGRCEVEEEEVALPCGHTARRVPCYEAAEPAKLRCRERVHITMPCCGHQQQVPCNERRQFLASPNACRHPVTVTLPGCGHTLTVECGKVASVLLDPTSCKERCSGVLHGCLHPCEHTCGKCFEVRLEPSSSAAAGATPSHKSTPEAVAAAKQGLVKLFKQEVNRDTAGTGLMQLWDDKRHNWQQFVKQEVAPAVHAALASEAAAVASTQEQLQQQGGADAGGTQPPGLVSRLQQLGAELARMGMRMGHQTGDTGDNGDTATAAAAAAGVQQLAPRQQQLLQLALLWLRWLQLVNTPSSAVNVRQLLVSTGSTAVPPVLLSVLPEAAAAAPGLMSSSPTAVGTLRALAPLHKRCGVPCSKALACGHDCSSACHQGAACSSSCRHKCDLKCEHAKCSLRCSDPCSACAEPCNWACEHQGPCLLPCGAPCQRLPCNARCQQVLACGHRCPGPCGEPCPGRGFCIHPDCKAFLAPRVLEQVVDLIMATTFDQLDESTVNVDPLVVLPCGHAFLTSTLDGHLEMSSVYHAGQPAAAGASSSAAAQGGCESPLSQWLWPVTPQEVPKPKGCPSCRAVIQGVRRYGRMTALTRAGLLQRKALDARRQKMKEVEKQLQAASGAAQEQQAAANSRSAEDDIREQLEHMKRTKPGGPSLLLLLRRPLQLLDQLRSQQQALLQLSSQKTPKQVIAEATHAQLHRAVQAGLLPQHRAHQQMQRCPLSSMPDAQGFCQAIGLAAQACIQHLQVNASTLQQAAALLTAADKRLSQQEVAADLIVAGNAKNYGYHQRRRALQELLRLLRDTVRSMLKEGRAAYEEQLQYIMWALQYAWHSSCYSQFYLLSLRHGQLLMQRAQQLQVLKLQPLAELVKPRQADIAGWEQHLLGQQQELLQQVVQAAEAATATAAQQQQNLAVQVQLERARLRRQREAGTVSGEDFAAAAADLLAQEDAIRQHTQQQALQQLRDLQQQVPTLLQRFKEESEEARLAIAAAVLGALFSNEFGRGYGDMGSWMQGHLYQCPNGHMYVIGECGGAMEHSRCPECGVTIGGAHHRLEASNRRADAAVVERVAQQATAARVAGRR